MLLCWDFSYYLLFFGTFCCLNIVLIYIDFCYNLAGCKLNLFFFLIFIFLKFKVAHLYNLFFGFYFIFCFGWEIFFFVQDVGRHTLLQFTIHWYYDSFFRLRRIAFHKSFFQNFSKTLFIFWKFLTNSYEFQFTTCSVRRERILVSKMHKP